MNYFLQLFCFHESGPGRTLLSMAMLALVTIPLFFIVRQRLRASGVRFNFATHLLLLLFLATGIKIAATKTNTLGGGGFNPGQLVHFIHKNPTSPYSGVAGSWTPTPLFMTCPDCQGLLAKPCLAQVFAQFTPSENSFYHGLGKAFVSTSYVPFDVATTNHNPLAVRSEESLPWLGRDGAKTRGVLVPLPQGVPQLPGQSAPGAAVGVFSNGRLSIGNRHLYDTPMAGVSATGEFFNLPGSREGRTEFIVLSGAWQTLPDQGSSVIHGTIKVNNEVQEYFVRWENVFLETPNIVPNQWPCATFEIAFPADDPDRVVYRYLDGFTNNVLSTLGFGVAVETNGWFVSGADVALTNGLEIHLRHLLSEQEENAETCPGAYLRRFDAFFFNVDGSVPDASGDGIPSGIALTCNRGWGVVHQPHLCPHQPDGHYDYDGDGLTNYEEVMNYFSDPFLYSSSGDGISDGDKVAEGYNPLLPGTGIGNHGEDGVYKGYIVLYAYSSATPAVIELAGLPDEPDTRRVRYEIPAGPMPPYGYQMIFIPVWFGSTYGLNISGGNVYFSGVCDEHYTPVDIGFASGSGSSSSGSSGLPGIHAMGVGAPPGGAGPINVPNFACSAHHGDSLWNTPLASTLFFALCFSPNFPHPFTLETDPYHEACGTSPYTLFRNGVEISLQEANQYVYCGCTFQSTVTVNSVHVGTDCHCVNFEVNYPPPENEEPPDPPYDPDPPPPPPPKPGIKILPTSTKNFAPPLGEDADIYVQISNYIQGAEHKYYVMLELFRPLKGGGEQSLGDLDMLPGSKKRPLNAANMTVVWDGIAPEGGGLVTAPDDPFTAYSSVSGGDPMPLFLPDVVAGKCVPSPYVEVRASIYRHGTTIPVAVSNIHRIYVAQVITIEWTPQAEVMFTNVLTYVHSGTNCVAIPAATNGFDMAEAKDRIRDNIQSFYDRANANIQFVAVDYGDTTIRSKGTVKRMLVTHNYSAAGNFAFGGGEFGGDGHTILETYADVSLFSMRNYIANECRKEMNRPNSTEPTCYTRADFEVVIIRTGVHEPGHMLGLVSSKYLGGGEQNSGDGWRHNPTNDVNMIMTSGSVVYLKDRVKTMTDGKWREVNKQFLEYRFLKP